MELYDQDAETRLLSALIKRLDRRSLIDVGTEQGNLAEELRASVEELHAFEPRSLGPLVDAGEIPRHVGMLKINAKCENLAIIRGMGALKADILVIEHWKDLPSGVGACPWISEEIVAELRPRGFGHFAFIVHQGEFITLKWDDAEAERGAVGNLVFLHESKLEQVLPEVLYCAGHLAERAVRVGRAYMRAWNDREALVKELRRAVDERLALIHELEQTTNERLALIDELKQAADDRLALIDELTEVSEARLQALESANAQIEKH
jgi:hypothetical protein